MKTIRTLILATSAIFFLSGCMTALIATAELDAKLQCLSDPGDNPKLTRVRGEFPFRLAYEKNGVQHVIEDTQICEFEKRSCTMYGRDEIWKSSLASGKTNIIIHQVDQTKAYLADLGSCRQMMSQTHYRKRDEDPEYPAHLAKYENGRFVGAGGGIWVKDELSKLGVRVVSFEQWSNDSTQGGP